MHYASDIAFTPVVKAIQQRKGSREAYAQVEQNGGWNTRITEDAKAFIEAQTSVFLATANSLGQPYVQHRGGPQGFLRVLDDQSIAFVDYAGNQQFITLGNLQENPQTYLFLIDYSQRRRLKIWGTAQVVEDDPEMVAQLMPKQYNAHPAQVIVFKVSAIDANCPQHIPRRFEASDVERLLAERDERIQELELQVRALQSLFKQL